MKAFVDLYDPYSLVWKSSDTNKSHRSPYHIVRCDMGRHVSATDD